MTVGDLREELAQYPDDALVVLSIDEEGNGFHEVKQAAGLEMFDRETKEIGLVELTAVLKARGYTDEDVMTTGQRCVVLWP